MSIATQASQGRIADRAAREGPPTATSRRLALAVEDREFVFVFAETVAGYLLRIGPQARRELARWQARADEIPDRELRWCARQAFAKSGNMEGAALFAALAPDAHARGALRALVAFQTAYNYLDALSERPSEDPVANAAKLHEALLVALSPGAPHPDYYAHNPDRDDGGYLTAIVDACRHALAGLPSFPAVAASARGAAARIVDFQALNLAEAQGGHEALERWATAVTPQVSGLYWWETAAAAGTSLSVHSLIAAAADPHVDRSAARDLDDAYFPWIGALHTLLDSLVDRREDERLGQRSLLSYYGQPPVDATTRMRALALSARDAAQRLPGPHAHRVILTAMCSYYLSSPECDTTEARSIAAALTETFGLPLNVAIAMFRARRRLRGLTGRHCA